MKRIAVLAVTAFGLALPLAASADEATAKEIGCLTCHNVSGAKKMGASFKDLAAKHKGNKDAEKAILEKLQNAKGHPKAKGTPEQQEKVVKWVLSQ